MAIDSKDLTVRPSADMENVAVSTSDPAQIPQMQSTLLAWCRAKLTRTKQETEDLEESLRIAAENGFKRNSFDQALIRSKKLVVYYEKIISAMEAGFVLFPTTDVGLFAVRTKRVNPDREWTQENPWGSDPRERGVPAQALPPGEGKYVGERPVVYVTKETILKKQPDNTAKEVQARYFHSENFDDVEFPFDLAKPQVMEATAQAMALKIFDEVGVLPGRAAARKGDPVIVGRIIHPRTKNRVSFLISWFVDTREL